MGTPAYVAPEVLRGQAYGLAVDMWSTGVICYILLGGYHPFPYANKAKLFSKIKQRQYEFHTQYWSDITPQAKDMISALLTTDPSKRMTAIEALRHPWMTQETPVLEKHLSESLSRFRVFNARRKVRQLGEGCYFRGD